MMIACSFCDVAQSLPMYDGGVHLFMLVNIGSQISQQSDYKTTKYVYQFINIMAMRCFAYRLLSCFVLSC